MAADEWGSRSPVRHAALVLVQLALGAALVLALGFGARTLLRRSAARHAPEGYTQVRPPVEVSALAIQGDTVWAGGMGGLYAIDRVGASPQPLPPGGPRLRHVRGLAVDAADRLWIAHRDGLTALDGGAWQSWTEADGLLPGPALAAYVDREGRVWVGAEGGVAVREGEGWRRITPEDGLGAPEVDVIYQDGAGAMWFGSASPTRGGLSRFDGLSWQFYTADHGLVHDSVNAILEAHDGALWVATGFANRGGASRLAGGEWSILRHEDGLAGEKVRSLFEDRDGRLWFGSEYDGVAIRDGATWHVLTPDDGLTGWEAKAILQDQDGAYWLGTEDGVTRIAHWRFIHSGGSHRDLR